MRTVMFVIEWVFGAPQCYVACGLWRRARGGARGESAGFGRHRR